MLKTKRFFKCLLLFLFVSLFIGTGCATAKKGTSNPKKKNVVHAKSKESLCDLSHLGKNKYFYSATYQKNLVRKTKKIAHHL
jgi:hypothetical protein